MPGSPRDSWSSPTGDGVSRSRSARRRGRTWSGFKDHADGTPSTWNDNAHTDRLYRWTWDQYLSEVRDVLSGKEDDVALTPDQEDAIKFAQGQLKYLEGGPSAAEPGPGRRGRRFARRISEALDEPAVIVPEPMSEEGR